MLRVRFYSIEVTGITGHVNLFQIEDNHHTMFSGAWEEHTMRVDLFFLQVPKSRIVRFS